MQIRKKNKNNKITNKYHLYKIIEFKIISIINI